MDNFSVIESRNLLEYDKNLTVNQIRNILIKNDLDGLSFDIQFKDEVIPNINFLKELDFIKGLQITTIYEYDLNVINELKQLEFLRIYDPTDSVLDISNLSNLREFSLEMKNNCKGIADCRSIEKLKLANQKWKNLKLISNLINIHELTINSCSINSLDGIQHLKNINQLSIENCRNLKDISKITELNRIKKLTFNICPKVYDYIHVKESVNLEFLEIVDCKKIKSLEFLDNLKKIKKMRIMGNSTIEDNNTVPLKKVPEVFYNHKEEYNFKIVNLEHEKIKNDNLKSLKRIFKRDELN
nr:hypothetical protein [uncultured Allomuricauda sp.]